MPNESFQLIEVKAKLQQAEVAAKTAERVYLSAIRIGLGDSERRKAHQEYLTAKANLNEAQIQVNKLQEAISGRPVGVSDFDIVEALDLHLESMVGQLEGNFQRESFKKSRENLLASLSSNRPDGGASVRFSEYGILLNKFPNDYQLFFAFTDTAEVTAKKYIENIDSRLFYSLQRKISDNLKASHDPGVIEQARAEAAENQREYDELVEKWTAVTLGNESPEVAKVYREDRAGYLSRKQSGRDLLLGK